MKERTPGCTSPLSACIALPFIGSAVHSRFARLRTSVDEAFDSENRKLCGSCTHLKRGPKTLKSCTSYPGRGATRKSNSLTSLSPVHPSLDVHVRRSVPGCSQSLPTTNENSCFGYASRSQHSESYVAT